LVSPSGSGTELIGIMGPVQYIAPSTIDSTMNIQIAALAYGRGGGYPAGVQAGVAPSSKKLTSVVATQSLSKVAREARISAIARLLASDQCLFGPNLVVEQNDPFADCQDATTWTTHTIDRTGKEDKRCDDPDRRPGEPMKMAYSWMYLGPGDFPNPTIGICRDRSDGKTIYRFKIERLQVYFNYLFCAQNVSTIGAIYKSLADLTSDQACQAKRDLEDRLPVLRDRSRKEKELALPVGGKYVLREELEAHELAHLRQDSIAIKNAMQVIAERILSKANLNTLSQAIAEFNNESNMKARATLVRGAIEAEIKMQQTKKARTYELAAQSAEAAKIESSLIPQLSKKCK